MRFTVFTCLLAALLGLPACGAPSGAEDWRALDIAAQDFVLLPCGTGDADTGCALVVAGGKRVLIGAPAGSGQAMRETDLRQLDAVIIFSLRSRDIEGLDEVRNRSWQAGRTDPLLTIGPPGIEQVIGALNLAFEQGDALYVVEQGRPSGGYDAAILSAQPVSADQVVFNTGDLKISRRADGFRVDYEHGPSAWLFPCPRAQTSAPVQDAETAVIIGCQGEVSGLTWPLMAPVFMHAKAS